MLNKLHAAYSQSEAAGLCTAELYRRANAKRGERGGAGRADRYAWACEIEHVRDLVSYHGTDQTRSSGQGIPLAYESHRTSATLILALTCALALCNCFDVWSAIPSWEDIKTSTGRFNKGLLVLL